jgi:hypothetical protein
MREGRIRKVSADGKGPDIIGTQGGTAMGATLGDPPIVNGARRLGYLPSGGAHADPGVPDLLIVHLRILYHDI